MANTSKENQVETFSFYKGTDTLESLVFQALGAASVCWENMDQTGIFQSDRAVAIGNALLERIKEFYNDTDSTNK